jgi:Uncharacterized protein conserved in bacteria (DUF2252)
MNIQDATSSYEKWMAAHTRLVAADLRRKHKLMRHAPFEFFRATFYRWMQLWDEVCPDLNKAPRLLAVGDLHVENFGTWRDAEGRLIWGCNDFDEAHTFPYTLDLVRLATSALLARAASHLAVRRRDASDVILDGYRDALEAGGRPYVLGEHHVWLRQIAYARLRDPVHFWRRIESQPPWKGPVPADVRRRLESMLPDRRLPCEIKGRVAGIGSLGHQRVLFVADLSGGRIAREAKALTPSACIWACKESSDELHYSEIVDRSVRVRDPFVRVEGNWVMRRLAPDCSRIELYMLPAKRDEERLLYAMGWETANIHLGSRAAISSVLRDLKKRPARWLHHAGKAMVAATRRDWKDYRRA